MPPRFVFASIQSMGAALRDHGRDLSGVVSIGGPETAWPDALRAWPGRSKHVLRIEFEDICMDLLRTLDRDGDRAPRALFSAEIAHELLDFGRARQGPILVHCAGGLSRSPACALLLAAQAAGPGREAIAADSIVRYGGGGFHPNSLIVHIGDAVLGRGGALCRIWEQRWHEGHPFDWTMPAGAFEV